PQPESLLEHYVVANARGVADARHATERKLETDRFPVRPITREVVKPCDQIPPNGRHFIDPDPLDSGGKLVVLAGRNLIDRLIEHFTSCLDVRVGHRQAASGLQFSEKTRLDVVEDAAPRQRIHALKGFRLRERLEAVKRRERELIWARAELLQRRD